MRLDAIRRLWERLQTSGARSLESQTDEYTDSELEFGRLVLPVLEDLDSARRLLDDLTGRARAAEVALNQLPVAALVLDEEGRLLTSNRAARALLGGPAVPATLLQAAARAIKEREEEALTIESPSLPGRVLRLVPGEMGEPTEAERPAVVFLLRRDAPPEMQVEPLRERFGLSKTETKVVTLVAQGVPNREVAERLGVSVETIRSHLQSAYRKTGAANRAALVALAYGARWGAGG